MPTISTVFVLLIIAFFVFSLLYFQVVCIYLHTRTRYRLFALRDRFRRIRIDHPSFDSHLYDLMELRLNGTIGLVPFISLWKILYFRWFGSFSDNDKRIATEMTDAVEHIRQNSMAGVEKLLHQIEIERKELLVDSVRFNSPLGATIAGGLKNILTHFLPSFVKVVQRMNASIEKTLQPMLVNAARRVQLSPIPMKATPLFAKKTWHST